MQILCLQTDSCMTGKPNRKDAGSSLHQYYSSSKQLSSGKREGSRMQQNSSDSKDIESDTYASGKARLDRVLAKLRKIAPLPGEDIDDPEADISEIIQIWREELSEMNAEEQSNRAIRLQRLKAKGVSYPGRSSVEFNSSSIPMENFWDDSFTDTESGEANRVGRVPSVKFAAGSGSGLGVRREVMQPSRMTGSGPANKPCRCQILEPELADLKKENAILRSSLQQLRSTRGPQPVDNRDKGSFAGSPSFKVGTKKPDSNEPAARAGDPGPPNGNASAVTYYQSKISLLETDLAAAHIKCQRLEDHLELIADSLDQELDVVEEDLLRALPAVRHFLPASLTTILRPLDAPPPQQARDPKGARAPETPAQQPRATSHCSQACQTDPAISPEAERRQALLMGQSPAPHAPALQDEPLRAGPAFGGGDVSQRHQAGTVRGAADGQTGARDVAPAAPEAAARESAQDYLPGSSASASEPNARGRAGSIVLAQRVLGSGYPSGGPSSFGGGPGLGSGGTNPSSEQKEQIQRLLRRIDDLTRERDSLALRVRTEESGRHTGPTLAGAVSSKVESKQECAPAVPQPCGSQSSSIGHLALSSSLQEIVAQVQDLINTFAHDSALLQADMVAGYSAKHSDVHASSMLGEKSFEDQKSVPNSVQGVVDYEDYEKGPNSLQQNTVAKACGRAEVAEFFNADPNARKQSNQLESRSLIESGTKNGAVVDFLDGDSLPKREIVLQNDCQLDELHGLVKAKPLLEDASVQTLPLSLSLSGGLLISEFSAHDQDYSQLPILQKLFLDAGQQTESDLLTEGSEYLSRHDCRNQSTTCSDAFSQTCPENLEKLLEHQIIKTVNTAEPEFESSCENSNTADFCCAYVDIPHAPKDDTGVWLEETVQTESDLGEAALETKIQSSECLSESIPPEQQTLNLHDSPIQEPETVKSRNFDILDQPSSDLTGLDTQAIGAQFAAQRHLPVVNDSQPDDFQATKLDLSHTLELSAHINSLQDIYAIEQEMLRSISCLPAGDESKPEKLEETQERAFVEFQRVWPALQKLVKQRALLIASEHEHDGKSGDYIADIAGGAVFDSEQSTDKTTKSTSDIVDTMNDAAGDQNLSGSEQLLDSTLIQTSSPSSSELIVAERNESMTAAKFKIMALPDEEITRRGVSMLMKTPTSRLSHAGSARIQYDARKNRLETLLPSAPRNIPEASPSNLFSVSNPSSAAFVVYGEDAAKHNEHIAKALDEALIQLRKEQEKVKQLTEKRKEMEKQAYTKAYATINSKMQHANYQGTLMDKCATVMKTINLAPMEPSVAVLNASLVEGLPHAPKFPVRTSKPIHGLRSTGTLGDQQFQMDSHTGRKGMHEKSESHLKRKSTPERESLEPWPADIQGSQGENRLKSHVSLGSLGFPNSNQYRKLPTIEKQTRQSLDSRVIMSKSNQLIQSQSNALDFPEISGASATCTSDKKAIIMPSVGTRNSPRKFSSSDLYAIDENSSSWLE